MDHRLFGPTRPLAPTAPLLVMLHGCTQDADDFAAGTRMNDIAESAGVYVLYPGQSSRANANRCWNWFETAHQRRGSGEPAQLVDLIQQVIDEHPIDEHRVFIAGLSAGGAMALILAEEYPELFAAVGVHSGLPTGAASNLSEALDAMRGAGTPSTRHGKGTGSFQAPSTQPTVFNGFSTINGAAVRPNDQTLAPLPLFVIHGERDRTVNPRNAERIVDNWLAQHHLASHTVPLSVLQRTDSTLTGRDSIVTTHEAQGTTMCEFWRVSQGGHHWAGGSDAGTHTDAQGPDASAEMMRFFLTSGRRH